MYLWRSAERIFRPDFQRHLFPAAHYRLLGMFCGFNFRLHENLQAATRRD